MMDAPVHAIDDQTDALAHLVASQPLVEHPAYNALGHLRPMQDVARGMAVLGQSLALQSPVHGLDDVAALAKLAQYRLGLWRHHPAADLDLGRQPHALQFLGTVD